MINQIAVFLENKKGRGYELTRVLADEGIDFLSMSIADTQEFGILRAVTSDNARAVKALRAAGFTVTATDLLGIEVDNKPGGLSDVLKKFSDGGVDIEYLYFYTKPQEDKAIILVKVDDNALAEKIAKESGIQTV